MYGNCGAQQINNFFRMQEFFRDFVEVWAHNIRTNVGSINNVVIRECP